jgi:RNA polymerase sigma-70 factor (ECF subfamily)
LTPSDEELVERVRRHDDREAFAALVRRHQGMLRAYLKRLTGGHAALADELAQEAFLKAYRGLGGFKGEARFSTWLVTIARRTFFDRSAADRHPASDAAPMATEEAGTDDDGDARAMKMDIDAALQRLSPAQRDAIVHCFLADLSHAEAAAVLQWPLGTLKSHVQRGLTRLRVLLKDWQPENTR